MEVLAYFLAMSNLHAIGGRNEEIGDVSMKVGDLGSLANYLYNYPGCNVEDFKEDQLSRVGDVGIYISNNVRKFLLYGEGNEDDEGVIVTFIYKIRGSSSVDGEKESHLENHSFLIRKEGLSEDLIRPLLAKFNNQNSLRNRLIIIRGPKHSRHV